ncbi:MAG: hypothetical protein ACF8CQ_10220 [Rhodopirellula sp. JB044]|uniref:hypothetical protein n=1 Tax=Rhodopirellula sp. JB044 TaxID=3342844 RepID=UPI00370C551E
MSVSVRACPGGTASDGYLANLFPTDLRRACPGGINASVALPPVQARRKGPAEMRRMASGGNIESIRKPNTEDPSAHALRLIGLGWIT